MRAGRCSRDPAPLLRSPLGGGRRYPQDRVELSPLTGASLTQTDTIVKSIQLKLKQINNTVCDGKYKIVL